MPFMLAQKLARPWAIMTACVPPAIWPDGACLTLSCYDSYNRINGTHVAENPNMLQDIVRQEWGFDGMFMSDWWGTYSVDIGINAGVDLEMPGITKWRTLDFTKRCVNARKVTVKTIKERALQVLKLVQKCARKAPEVSLKNSVASSTISSWVDYGWEILDGDKEERTHESEEDTALLRQAAAESIVLLKNDNGILPVDKTKVKKVAIVGGNAKAAILSGGGSAALKPSYFVSPYDGIVKALGKDVEVTYSEGARGTASVLTCQRSILILCDPSILDVTNPGVGSDNREGKGQEGVERRVVFSRKRR